jgi:predicted DNA-binding ribbon-helix-helix protein
MCQYYANADPILYESRTRTLRIEGVLTTIRLENFVWETISKMAEAEGSSTNELISTLHREVHSYRGECPNFASFLRVTALRYLALEASKGKAEPESTNSSVTNNELTQSIRRPSTQQKRVH